MALLYLTILVNFWFQHEPSLLEGAIFQNNPSSWWGYEWHSHQYTTVKSMFVSLFTHADWEHVLTNMFLLWAVGKQLFVPTMKESSPTSLRRARQGTDGIRWAFSCWASPLAFLWIYLGSQVVSVAGCRMISHLLDREWERQVRLDRRNWSWTWVPDSWKDSWFTISNAQQAIELRAWQYTPMIGSSAAVFGVIGAHMYAALCSAEHPAQMDAKAQLMWLGKIAMELARTPFSLEQISLLMDSEDNIDHASHVCGFVGGLLLAGIWDAFARRSRSREEPFRYHEV
eukprot:CAMPEP_0178733560 /NCGR_PEP_ID=MMETSP0744-20121128/856_1 /TAXON_ID=913974 /ORGANISM="Nitzschia punctata, Strain CCMP561" /LENGTH=284 /DNA_ID=CAMNT_0020385743 /DNA_START=84 /DNA_END=938 /DNA_ORIENTATION=+